MREALKRLERLEEQAGSGDRLVTRIIVELVGAKDGRPVPRNITYAETWGETPNERIERRTGETESDFEGRAASRFPGNYVIG